MGNKITLIMMLFLFGFAYAIPVSVYAQGAEAFNNSGLPIPRFVSLNKDKVFVRTGPGQRYPIKWIFVQRGMPVEIIQEFDTWRKIKDLKGEEGWIHQSLLSGKRNGVVTPKDGVTIIRKVTQDAKPVAHLEQNVQVSLDKCLSGWCRVSTNSFSGWMQINSLWGVYEDEELD